MKARHKTLNPNLKFVLRVRGPYIKGAGQMITIHENQKTMSIKNVKKETDTA